MRGIKLFHRKESKNYRFSSLAFCYKKLKFWIGDELYARVRRVSKNEDIPCSLKLVFETSEVRLDLNMFGDSLTLASILHV